MKAIILAAGRGSRMKNLTDERPKCLVELYDKPLLEHQLAALNQAGIDEIAIVSGYRSELLSDYGLMEFHNVRWIETNMVSSLSCAQDWLQAEPCIVSYSDIFYGASAVKSLIENRDELALTYDPNWLELWSCRFEDPLLDAETFRMAPDQKLSEIGKQPQSIDEVEGQYMGLLRFTPRGWAEVLRIRKKLSSVECDKMHMTETLQRVLEAGNVSITAMPYLGKWGEVDSIEDLSLYKTKIKL